MYIGNEPPAPSAEALIVPKDSPVKSVADLKGKKTLLPKARTPTSCSSNRLRMLAEVSGCRGGSPTADARAAFESGRVDAWTIWDPFLAAAEKQLNARAVADGKGAVANHQFYPAARAYAEKYPEIVHILLEEIDKIDQVGKRTRRKWRNSSPR